ncbi:flippase-like domain-containing protein [Streptomyces sp. PSKA54]|uniref:Flippase-like domain-containing protein n=1 Tax=Streptomyces himalayensis subsp. aureolus TaxID=2758039 RepID=A0A7W2HE54_9ACTN|nr:lysylphosphatidylglycerol synthase transmembrane domain-containing protein [Streptomyces himalayensis]MBA4860475.1 flippase-like domain-containing protein [Streptomyces himalayensis subsp. aureolus]
MSPLQLDELPRTQRAPDSSPSVARRVRRALCLLPLLLIGVWTAAHWRVVHDGAARLTSADPRWLLTGAVFTCLCWAAASCIRQGAIPERLPPGLLLASQFAAGAANHVLPAGLGAHAVTLRFLQGRGIPLARATASLALYSLVKPIAGMLLILTLLAAFPGTLRLGELFPGERALLLAIGVLVSGLAAAALLVTAIRPLRRLITGFVRTALTDARLLHTRPSRILALWGGAAAFPLLQASVVASVGASLDLPLPWAHVALAYLAASAAAGAIPTPGGIGSVDAALVLTLSAFGAPVALATATVIGYRVLTVWLPLLPGALVLTALVRGKVL